MDLRAVVELSLSLPLWSLTTFIGVVLHG